MTEGTGFRIPPAPAQRDGLRITDGTTIRGELTLPPAHQGKAWLLDLDAGSPSEAVIADVVKALKKATAEGRSAWVLIR